MKRNRSTAEQCKEISQGYAVFAYPWNTPLNLNVAPLEGVEDSSHPSRVGPIAVFPIPGVRTKRVPLANFLAPLRGAEQLLFITYFFKLL